MLHIVGVHRLNLLASRSTQDFNNLYQLVDATLSGEEWLTKHQLRHHTSSRPYVNVGRVVCGAKDELWSTVVPRADVADVWFAGDQNLGATKVAKFENTSLRVQEQILRLDVTMADADRVNVRERAEKLIHVKLDLEDWHWLFELDIMSAGAIYGLGDKLEDEIEVYFVFLFTIRIKEGSEFDDVWMADETHDLELTVLETFVLEYFLDCYLLLFLGHVEKASGEDDAKGAIANDFTVCILDFFWFSSFAVRSDDLDYPRRVVREFDTVDGSGHWIQQILWETKLLVIGWNLGNNDAH